MDFLRDDHATVMVLLAIVINYPRLSGDLLGALTVNDDKKGERSLHEVTKSLRCNATTSGTLDKREFDNAREELLGGLHALKPELLTVRLPVQWAGEVGRYTFQ